MPLATLLCHCWEGQADRRHEQFAHALGRYASLRAIGWTNAMDGLPDDMHKWSAAELAATRGVPLVLVGPEGWVIDGGMWTGEVWM